MKDTITEGNKGRFQGSGWMLDDAHDGVCQSWHKRMYGNGRTVSVSVKYNPLTDEIVEINSDGVPSADMVREVLREIGEER